MSRHRGGGGSNLLQAGGYVEATGAVLGRGARDRLRRCGGAAKRDGSRVALAVHARRCARQERRRRGRAAGRRLLQACRGFSARSAHATARTHNQGAHGGRATSSAQMRAG